MTIASFGATECAFAKLKKTHDAAARRSFAETPRCESLEGASLLILSFDRLAEYLLVMVNVIELASIP